MVMPNRAVETQGAMGAGTEGGRRPTVVPAPIAANPEISDRPGRRTFTAPEKLRILKEADQAAGTGEIGAILRRHGLYSSALGEWRRQREAGTLGGLTPARRGPKSRPVNPLATELASEQKENAQLRRRLERAEAIIEVQKTCRSTGNPVGADRARDRARQHALTEGLASAMPVKGTVSATSCSARPVARQPATQHQTPIPSADRSAVTAQPSQSVAGRVAANCARSAPFAPLCRSGTGRNLRHLARRGRLPLLGQHHVSPSCRQQRAVLVRRKQLRYPIYTKPELPMAVCPNEVWSWDITKLKGPAKWTYFYLYVIIDIFSRRVVGWCVADAESACLFKALLRRHHRQASAPPPGQLDPAHGPTAWGSLMKAKATAFLLADLGVTKSHRPAAYLKRQSVLGKSLQDPEISANLLRPASAAWRMLKSSAGRFSPGIIRRIITQAWA